MTTALTGEARKRLDAHLDAVEAALIATNKSREERRAVIDDLESQILDMLGLRGPEVTAEEVDDVLSRMDPPAAYVEGSVAREPPGTSYADTMPLQDAPESGKNPTKKNWRNLMRSVVVIALIVCGTLLVMTPAISDYLQYRSNMELNIAMVQRTAPFPEGMSFSYRNLPMSDMARFSFWLTGSATILLGVIGGFAAFARERRERLETMVRV